VVGSYAVCAAAQWAVPRTLCLPSWLRLLSSGGIFPLQVFQGESRNTRDPSGTNKITKLLPMSCGFCKAATSTVHPGSTWTCMTGVFIYLNFQPIKRDILSPHEPLSSEWLAPRSVRACHRVSMDIFLHNLSQGPNSEQSPPSYRLQHYVIFSCEQCDLTEYIALICFHSCVSNHSTNSSQGFSDHTAIGL
jgi:hypothetical protein